MEIVLGKKDDEKDTEEEQKWKVNDAIESLMRYQKLMEDKKIKEATKEELKKRASEMQKVSEEI